MTRFRSLLESQFRHHHLVASYADKLGLTPGHLNHLCKHHLGQTASELIQGRIFSEASRLLAYSDQDVASISRALGFADPSYFSRAFRRHTGTAPLKYRQHSRQRRPRSPEYRQEKSASWEGASKG